MEIIPPPPREKPSKRELEVLQLIVLGNTNPEIAVALYISEPTVKKHREKLMRKLKARNVVQLIANARSYGFLPPPQQTG